MNKFKLSVIVTSYNYEKYIESTIKQLINQTRNDFEIIIIDDGSTDKSIDIIEEYVKKFKNINFIQHSDKKNHGLRASIIYALEQSRGEYIAFCESDDYWELNHVEILLNNIQTSKKIILLNNVICINNSKNKIFDSYTAHCNNFLKNKNQKNIFYYMYWNPIPTFSAVCIRKDILMKCNFNSPIKPYLDFWLWRQICFSNKIYFLEECKTYWRRHNKSYIMTSHIENYNDFIISSNNIISKEHLLTKYQKFILQIRVFSYKYITYVRSYRSFIKRFLQKS